MHLTCSTMLAAVLAAVSVAAQDTNYLGFNSGATMLDGQAKSKDDFAAEMRAAKALVGAPGEFSVFRLYTTIQAGTAADPSAAFEAAIETDTRLLLGIWTSGTTTIKPQIEALKAGVEKYKKRLTDRVIGVSVGSEDLYRNSVVGVKNKAGMGADVDTVVGFLGDFRDEFKDSPLGRVPLGHVDTWDAWTNSTNRPVIDAVDFLGVDEYPYYQNGTGNSIDQAGRLFDNAFKAVEAVAGGKPIWVTETGWPVSGPKWDEAEATPANAGQFWRDVGCHRLFGKVPTFWYTLRDSNAQNKMQFSIVDKLGDAPRFNLTCPTSSNDDDDGKSSGDSSDDDSKSDTSSSGSSSTSASGSGSTSASGSGSTSASTPASISAPGSGSTSASTPASMSASGFGSTSASTPASTLSTTSTASTTDGSTTGSHSGSGSSSSSCKMVASSSLAAAIAIAGAFFLL